MSTHIPLMPLPANAGEDLRVVIVQAEFNADITHDMVRRCRAELIRSGVSEGDIFLEQVPGALEVPTALKWSEGHYQPSAMIALGCVIRGDTYHFEIVANQSASAIMDLSLSLNEGRGMGIANGILTCNTREQALERLEPTALACAHTAIRMALLKEKLDSPL